MKRHETPREIAHVLARHAPKKLGVLLDPAVGSGALLVPFRRILCNSRAKAYGFDIDQEALGRARERLGRSLGPRLRLWRRDFLRWVAARRAKKSDRLSFDCVVMNPPFSGRKSEWVQIEGGGPGDPLPGNRRWVPIEVAFLVAAVEVLRPGGRLLGILPCSVISSNGGTWLRKALLRCGAIHHVHELPPYTFERVESRAYLLVFQKGARGTRISLLNHDLARPERLVVNCADLGRESRLDHRYHAARARLSELMSALHVEWKTLGSIAVVRRGRRDSPVAKGAALHTDCYRTGFWLPPHANHSGPLFRRQEGIRLGDILVRRVGRSCARSVGTGHDVRGLPCSDCVLLIRPKPDLDSTQLLFALRGMMQTSWGPDLLERGTGASYITGDSLRELRLPLGLAERWAALYEKYRAAVRGMNFGKMQAVEQEAAKRFTKLVGRPTESRVAGQVCRAEVR